MAYGELKVDSITFTNGGTDTTVSVSGLVQNPTFSGNITVTGTISGDVVLGGTTVSGATVTGNAGQFTTLTGATAGFTTVTGTTVTGTTANFVSGVFNGVYGETDTNTNIQFPGSDVIIFNEGGSEAARIDSNGRLLVGTSTVTALGTTNYGINQFSAGNVTNQGILLENGVAGGGHPRLAFVKHRAGTSGGTASVNDGDSLGGNYYYGGDGTSHIPAASIVAIVDGTPGINDMPCRLVFSVTANSSALPTEALRISNDRSITISDGGNVVLGTTTGTKIGTATSQKIGFYDATPVVQPTTGVAEAAFVQNSGGTAVNVNSTFGGYTIQQVVEALQTLGLLA